MALVRTESETVSKKGQTSTTEVDQTVTASSTGSVTDSGRTDSGNVSEAMVMQVSFTLRFGSDKAVDPDLYGSGPSTGC